MLPISDVHFAFCGIATVAATLGYACARRALSLATSTNEPSKVDLETGQLEERSLKRKLADSDEDDTDQEELSRPMKRNRTPPIHKHESDDDFNQEWELVVAPPPYEHVVALRQSEEPVQDKSTPPQECLYTIELDATPVRLPTPSAYPETSPQPEDKGEAERCPTPQPSKVNPSPNEPVIPPSRPITPPQPTAPPKIERVNAFSAFSGSSSPFASYSNPSGTSPFALSVQTASAPPAWRRDKANDSRPASSANALALSPNDGVATSLVLSQNESALGAPRETQSLAKSTICLTGEEDENVEAELKAVKLFVKRGHKEFTNGMYGHVKILSQKSTPQKAVDEGLLETEVETKSRTRLLFRRDPLGQVSMNVGLHPTIRCYFDNAETVLRIVLMEQVTTDGKDVKEDVVIYALKPGRAQKTDFESFAKTLCDHTGLKSRVATSPTTPSGDAPTAS